MGTVASGAIRKSAANKYEENADFWIRIIRGDHDKFRTGLTNAAMLDAIGPVEGLRVLDAGCGEGYLARELTGSGAAVLGVDSSQNLIDAATALVPPDAASPIFQVQDVNDLRLDTEQFDLITCNHVMNDLANPVRPITEFARVLRPGGRLVVLMLHPCFYGERASRSDLADNGPGLSYFSPRQIRQRFNVDGISSPEEVTSYHRPLEFYIAAFRDAGLWLIDLQEPHPTSAQVRDDAWWQTSFTKPLFLLMIAQKHAAVPLSGR